MIAAAAAAAAAVGAAATGESSLIANVASSAHFSAARAAALGASPIVSAATPMPTTPTTAATPHAAPPDPSDADVSIDVEVDVDVGDFDAAGVGARAASPAPTIVRTPSSRPARGPSMVDDDEVDPEALAGRLAQLTRDALIQGDAQSLERWADGLKATGERDGFAERMRAMARLSKGRVGDAISRLQRVRREAEGTPPAQRCQAALALAVGYAFAGRSDEALLEALDALARAREGDDDLAIRACMALLAKLYAREGRGAEAAALLAGAMH